MTSPPLRKRIPCPLLLLWCRKDTGVFLCVYVSVCCEFFTLMTSSVCLTGCWQSISPAFVLLSTGSQRKAEPRTATSLRSGVEKICSYLPTYFDVFVPLTKKLLSCVCFLDQVMRLKRNQEGSGLWEVESLPEHRNMKNSSKFIHAEKRTEQKVFSCRLPTAEAKDCTSNYDRHRCHVSPYWGWGKLLLPALQLPALGHTQHGFPDTWLSCFVPCQSTIFPLLACTHPIPAQPCLSTVTSPTLHMSLRWENMTAS